MTRRIVLISVDADTGEIINRDGTVTNHIVPKHYSSLLARTKVDLTGAVIELPDRDARSCEFGEGYDQCLTDIKAQMPKEGE